MAIEHWNDDYIFVYVLNNTFRSNNKTYWQHALSLITHKEGITTLEIEMEIHFICHPANEKKQFFFWL